MDFYKRAALSLALRLKDQKFLRVLENEKNAIGAISERDQIAAIGQKYFPHSTLAALLIGRSRARR
jgi:hypothetical protein